MFVDSWDWVLKAVFWHSSLVSRNVFTSKASTLGVRKLWAGTPRNCSKEHWRNLPPPPQTTNLECSYRENACETLRNNCESPTQNLWWSESSLFGIGVLCKQKWYVDKNRMSWERLLKAINFKNWGQMWSAITSNRYNRAQRLRRRTVESGQPGYHFHHCLLAKDHEQFIVPESQLYYPSKENKRITSLHSCWIKQDNTCSLFSVMACTS